MLNSEMSAFQRKRNSNYKAKVKISKGPAQSLTVNGRKYFPLFSDVRKNFGSAKIAVIKITVFKN